MSSTSAVGGALFGLALLGGMALAVLLALVNSLFWRERPQHARAALRAYARFYASLRMTNTTQTHGLWAFADSCYPDSASGNAVGVENTQHQGDFWTLMCRRGDSFMQYATAIGEDLVDGVHALRGGRVCGRYSPVVLLTLSREATWATETSAAGGR